MTAKTNINWVLLLLFTIMKLNQEMKKGAAEPRMKEKKRPWGVQEG